MPFRLSNRLAPLFEYAMSGSGQPVTLIDVPFARGAPATKQEGIVLAQLRSAQLDQVLDIIGAKPEVNFLVCNSTGTAAGQFRKTYFPASRDGEHRDQ